MEIHGGVIAGIARATSPIRENDSSRPWREFVRVAPTGDGQAGLIIASDGYMVARATVPQPCEADGLLRRRDAERFDKQDAIDLGLEKDSQGTFAEMRVRDSEVRIDLDATLPDDSPYPDGPSKTLLLHPRGRPAFRVDPKVLRRALQVFIEGGVEHVQVFTSPKIGDGLLFLEGTNDADVMFEVCIGFPRTASRKQDDGTVVVDVFEASPLFPEGAEPVKPDEVVPPAAAADAPAK